MLLFAFLMSIKNTYMPIELIKRNIEIGVRDIKPRRIIIPNLYTIKLYPSHDVYKLLLVDLTNQKVLIFNEYRNNSK